MGSTGTYGKQYYFDYPSSAPLARIIMISPGLSIYAPANFPSYAKGTPSYQWVADTIDGARAAGTPWVIVTMAFDCITAGEKVCEIGRDLFNMLVDKRVDLILQGHEHGYERSKQLALGPGCPTMAVGSFNAACVAADGLHGSYTKGAGTVVVVAGTAGITLRPMNPSDPEAPYFDKLMGANINPGKGFVKYSVTPTRLSADFVPSVPTSFEDSFTVTSDAAASAPTSTPPAAPAGDPTVIVPTTTPPIDRPPGAAGPGVAPPTSAATTNTPRAPTHPAPPSRLRVTGATTTSTVATTSVTAIRRSATVDDVAGTNRMIGTAPDLLGGTPIGGSERHQKTSSTGLPVRIAATAALALTGAGVIRRCTRSGRHGPVQRAQEFYSPGDDNGVRCRSAFLAALVSTVPVARMMGPRPMARRARYSGNSSSV
jgi:hypothetical protein